MDQTQQEAYNLLFEKYPVAISHLHQQLVDDCLGVVLGAGIGIDLNFPRWEDLVKNIANDSRVEGQKLFENISTRPITSQMLFQVFKEKYIATDEGNQIYKHFGDIELRKKWKELIHDVLYKDVSNDPDEWLKKNPYLYELIYLIKKSKTMTVTYNFDDTIERLLYKYNTDEGSRGFTVAWDPNVQMEKRSNIIYHPNGYLPRKMSEYASMQLVFLEDSFEDQLVDSFSGHYNALNNHYSSKTCLFLGISLKDQTLKHMLRMNAKKCYGHMHYIIRIVKDKDDMSNKDFVNAETKANFETYNLYTMYLTNQETKTLFEMIRLPSDNFCKVCPAIPQMRKYFVMGAVAAGKSTTVNQFKCFKTFDEWLEDMPDDMEKAPSVITDESENDIDNWIAQQINLKNCHLDSTMRVSRPSVAIIDRTPIDAFAFIKIKEEDNEDELWKAKARLIKKHLSSAIKLTGGKIIFLKGNISEMVKRAKQKFRVYKEKDLKEQQNALLHLAEKAKEKHPSAVEFIDVTNKSIEQVAKEVSEIIYFQEYAEVDFQCILDSIEQNGKNFV